MPIKDLVESYRFGDGLPRLAIIRKGAAKTSETRPGADLVTHFRVVMQPPYERYAGAVQYLFGEKPEIFAPVRFFAPHMEDVYSFWMTESTKTKLLHQCDGETETRWFDLESGKNMRGERPCSGKAEDGGCACKPTAELRCYLPSLNAEIGLPGYVSFVTTSWNDVRNLMACFLDIERMGFYDLRQVEFAIGRAMRPVNTPVAQPKNTQEAAEFRKQFKHDWKPGEKAKRNKSLMYLRVTEKFSREFVLPPPLASAQLPSGIAPHPESLTGRAIITVNSPARPPRRIGTLAGPPPLLVEADEDEDAEVTAGELVIESSEVERPSDDDPNRYHVDQLIVNKTRTATQYILAVQRSATRIPVTVDQLPEGAMNGVPLAALERGAYPLVPVWSVYADTTPEGRWDVHSIDTGIPLATGSIEDDQA